MSTIDLELDSSLSYSAEVGIATISSQSKILNLELSSVNEDINDLESELAVIDDVCKNLKTCNGCTYNSNCVWCSSISTCVAGDNEGPFGLECSSWEYSYCLFSACSRYDTCSSCLGTQKCGWCEHGRDCVDSVESCIPTFYYETGDKCPHDEPVDIVVLENPIKVAKLWEELKKHKERADELQFMIEDLDKDQNDILISADEGIQVDVNSFGLYSDLSDLIALVDDAKIEEDESSIEFQEELADQIREDVIQSVTENSDKSTEKVIDNIEKEYTEVETDVKEMESSLTESLTVVAESVSTISEEILENSYKLIEPTEEE